jgi:hypothetical protein
MAKVCSASLADVQEQQSQVPQNDDFAGRSSPAFCCGYVLPYNNCAVRKIFDAKTPGRKGF